MLLSDMISSTTFLVDIRSINSIGKFLQLRRYLMAEILGQEVETVEGELKKARMKFNLWS
jgi:hypothetical protein